MVTFRKLLVIMVLLVVISTPTVAPKVTYSKAEDCPQIVVQALDATEQVCGATGRNEACYGYMLVDAEAQPDVENFSFSTVGDLEDVVSIRNMRLSGMNEESGEWGIALMRLQANLPDETRAKNVTLLIFGDVAFGNGVSAAHVLDITAPTNLNVRNRPALDGAVVGNLGRGMSAVVDGRSGDSEWLHVTISDSDLKGWIYTSTVMDPSEAEVFDIVDHSVPHYQPMQAFYFQSAQNDSACPEAPDSGLLIQTPEGVGQVTFLINEVDIRLGSTVYFQAQAGGEMAVIVVEGHAYARAYGVTSRANAGSYLTIPLTDDLRAAGPPGLPRAYDMASVNALPIQSLERDITIHPPLTEEELADLVDEIETETSNNGAALGLDNDASGRVPVPGGGTINNPIFGQETPGQGGTPPGQEKKN